MSLGVRGVVSFIDHAAGTAHVSQLKPLPTAADFEALRSGRADFLPSSMPMDRYGVSQSAVIHRDVVSPEVWEALEKNQIVEGTVKRDSSLPPHRGPAPLNFTDDVFVTPYREPKYAR